MKAIRSPNTSSFYMWNGIAAIFFSSCVTPFHNHNTMQIVFDIQDCFKLRTKDKTWCSYKSLIIKENIIHQLDTHNSVQLILYLDAATRFAGIIRNQFLYQKEICPAGIDILNFIMPDELQKVLLKPNPELLGQLVNKLLKALSGEAIPEVKDVRIKTIQSLISSGRPGEISIDILAEKVFLSESRLRALFKEVTGVSLYKYILWNKIRFGINLIMSGCTIVEASYNAGFTDSSHFHKMMIKMFGISPSQFIKDNRKMNILLLDESPLSFETRIFEEDDWTIKKVFK